MNGSEFTLPSVSLMTTSWLRRAPIRLFIGRNKRPTILYVDQYKFPVSYLKILIVVKRYLLEGGDLFRKSS